MNLRVGIAAASLLLAVAAAPVAAHAPMVVEPGNESPATAFALEDPTLSRAIGATLDAPGEMDWYRMDLRAGDALVVEVTAPDAAGGIPTSFAVLGPGLPAPADDRTSELATASGADGALAHEAEGGEREVHGGLGFIAWGGVRTTAPEDGTYWVAVRAAEDGVTGKYVLAPGVREEFGPEAVGGMADLVSVLQRSVADGAGSPPPTEGAGTVARRPHRCGSRRRRRAIRGPPAPTPISSASLTAARAQVKTTSRGSTATGASPASRRPPTGRSSRR